MKRFITLLVIFLISFGCKDKSKSYQNSYFNYEEGYEDGKYCAEIEYYYFKTGTRSTYILEVEIEDNELIVIYWPNGGWLDDSHFYPPDISDGNAEFESDRGVEYTVEIIGEEGDCYLSNDAHSESSFIDNEEEDYVCSRCGDSKYEYDDYCDDCTDELENTCSRCGFLEYGVYQGICSSCKEDENDDN